jgi:endonuclease/exonuclease/phosphatase family metal-dependent hydrolase
VVDYVAPERVALRVMTWNLRGSRRPDLADVARVAFDARVDLLAVQEVQRPQCARLVDLLGMPESRWLLKHRPFGLVGARWSEGIAVLSRFPVVASTDVVLNPGVPLRSFRRRVAQDVVVTTGAGPVRLVNTHLASDDDASRAEQTERLLGVVGDQSSDVPIDRTILLGDLNTVGDDAVTGALARAGLADAWTGAHGGADAEPTNPADAPYQRIDYVLAGGALRVTSAEVPAGGPRWARLSDHLPITVELEVPRAAQQPGG